MVARPECTGYAQALELPCVVSPHHGAAAGLPRENVIGHAFLATVAGGEWFIRR